MSQATTNASGPSTKDDALAKLRIRRDEQPKARSGSAFGKFLKFVFGGILLLVLLVGGYIAALATGIAGEQPKWLELPAALQQKVEVRLASVIVERGRAAEATVVATGYLESRRQAKIGARAAGRIEQVLVEEGSPVKQGETLAILEHSDMDASLNAAKAQLARSTAEVAEQKVMINNLQRVYERAKTLYAQRNISDAEYEDAEYQYQAAVARLTSLQASVELSQARVREAEQTKENMFIYAPFDGTIISKDGEVGESIMPGGMGEASGRGSVVTIADLQHLEVDCDVKEDFISRIKVDQDAEVAVDAVPGNRYRGKVRKIIPMGDRARATIKVKVEITDADGRLFPDMSSTVYFLPDADAKLQHRLSRIESFVLPVRFLKMHKESMCSKLPQRTNSSDIQFQSVKPRWAN